MIATGLVAATMNATNALTRHRRPKSATVGLSKGGRAAGVSLGIGAYRDLDGMQRRDWRSTTALWCARASGSPHDLRAAGDETR